VAWAKEGKKLYSKLGGAGTWPRPANAAAWLGLVSLRALGLCIWKKECFEPSIGAGLLESRAYWLKWWAARKRGTLILGAVACSFAA